MSPADYSDLKRMEADRTRGWQDRRMMWIKFGDEYLAEARDKAKAGSMAAARSSAGIAVEFYAAAGLSRRGRVAERWLRLVGGLVVRRGR